jgi:hypothetical protein
MGPSVILNAAENKKSFASDGIRNTDRGKCQEMSKSNYRKCKEIFYVDENKPSSLWKIDLCSSRGERSDRRKNTEAYFAVKNLIYDVM